MITLLTALRLVSLAVWSGLFVYMLPGALTALHGANARRGDAMRLGTAAVALLMICGTLRWLIAPESETALVAIQTASIGVACFVIWLAKVYGRGPRV